MSPYKIQSESMTPMSQVGSRKNKGFQMEHIFFSFFLDILINISLFFFSAFFNVTLYNTYTLFHHHMCQVCGSFQCPFCPGYNTAQKIQPQIAVSIVILQTVLIPILLGCWRHYVCGILWYGAHQTPRPLNSSHSDQGGVLDICNCLFNVFFILFTCHCTFSISIH